VDVYTNLFKNWYVHSFVHYLSINIDFVINCYIFSYMHTSDHIYRHIPPYLRAPRHVKYGFNF